MRDEAIIETRRRARPRHGLHRRAPLPPLMSATVASRLDDRASVLDAARRRALARALEAVPRRAIDAARSTAGITPGLGTILVGDDPTSRALRRA